MPGYCKNLDKTGCNDVGYYDGYCALCALAIKDKELKELKDKCLTSNCEEAIIRRSGLIKKRDEEIVQLSGTIDDRNWLIGKQDKEIKDFVTLATKQKEEIAHYKDILNQINTLLIKHKDKHHGKSWVFNEHHKELWKIREILLESMK